MIVALTRPVSDSIAECELTHQERLPIDPARARRQHAAYEEALRGLGVEVVRVAGASALPDAVFIEDTAIVLDEAAIVTRPGAASRRAETDAVGEALAIYRPVRRIAAPATLDGGDVLRAGRTLFVGRSSRTSVEGIEQLRDLAGPLGYDVISVPVTGCLHLKSAVTGVAEGVVLLNPDWVPESAFGEYERIAVDPLEPAAANALPLRGSVIFPTHHPRTADRLARRGLDLVAVECDELAKAEGGVTCCSLLVELAPASAR